MAPRRVVITGVGVISALGLDRHGFWSALCDGRSGIGPIESLDTSGMSFHNGAEVKDFDPERLLPNKEDRALLDRCVQFALVSAREAVLDAGMEWTEEQGHRAAVVMGCGGGGKITEDAEYKNLYKLGKKRAHPLLVPKTMMNAGASRISFEFKLRGPVFTLSTACSSSNHAIGQAFHMVRNGLADTAIAGGHEAFFTYSSMKAWDALRVVDPDTCRPFSKDRQGMVLGEGAGMLILETLEAAKDRGADIYAEIVGFGMSADAHHVTMPSEEGPARAIQGALDDGGMTADEVDYINAHGTATVANDPNEVKVIRRVLGNQADRVAVSSTKSMHGHGLGAAGALEGVATALAIKHQIQPPTANFTTPDPECNIDAVPNEARSAPIRGALSNSFAFGGLNAILAFRRFEGS